MKPKAGGINREKIINDLVARMSSRGSNVDVANLLHKNGFKPYEGDWKEFLRYGASNDLIIQISKLIYK